MTGPRPHYPGTWHAHRPSTRCEIKSGKRGTRKAARGSRAKKDINANAPLGSVAGVRVSGLPRARRGVLKQASFKLVEGSIVVDQDRFKQQSKVACRTGVAPNSIRISPHSMLR